MVQHLKVFLVGSTCLVRKTLQSISVINTQIKKPHTFSVHMSGRLCKTVSLSGKRFNKELCGVIRNFKQLLSK